MSVISKGALALLLFGCARVGSAELIIEGVENGVICDPPDVAQVVEEQFARSPMDPSQPDANVLPTSPLVVGTFALAPDVASSERTQVGYGGYVACAPAPGLEVDAPPPRTQALPEG